MVHKVRSIHHLYWALLMGKPVLYSGNIWTVTAPISGAHYRDAQLTAHPQGALVVERGKVVFCGAATQARKIYRQVEEIGFGKSIIIPGFIDCHLHMPQLDIIGSDSADLLSWLTSYTFPKEAEFIDPAICDEVSKRLVSLLLANGITASAIYGASTSCSAESLFRHLDQSGLRAVVGKVSMDRHAPSALLHPAKKDRQESLELIQRWHGKDQRLYYALTPRFAPSCSQKLLTSLGKLKELYPDLYIQTHISESKAEIHLAKKLFPQAKDYLGIYDDAGLHSARTIYGHGIHLTARELNSIKATGASIAHCPTSNSFLASGMMPLQKYLRLGIKIGLASDIGGGTNLSPWRTMAEAYLTAARLDQRITAATALYLATQGGAGALDMATVTGSLGVGMEADFQVLSLARHPYLHHRQFLDDRPDDLLLAMILTGDDRMTEAVYVRGRKVYG